MVNYIAAGGIFLVTFIAILRERVDQAILSLAGAAAMIIAGIGLGFYSQEAAFESIDFDTLGLLLGMMILVTMLAKTGFFQYVAIRFAKRSNGKPWRLLVVLGAITAVLSMFLPNVSTIVLIAPVSILIAEILGISPMPFLISQALLANTGGVATLVGDPPNILIGSAAGLNFDDFLMHLAPIILVCLVTAMLLMRRLFKKDLSKRAKGTRALAHIDENEALHDRRAYSRTLTVLLAVIFLFFIHDQLGITPAAVALLGASAALLWVQPNLDELLKEVEWSVLLFFGGLFVLIGGVEASGLLQQAASQLTALAQSDLLVFGLALLWFSAILSAIVDNVPLTIIMIPLISGLSAGGAEVTPLWWALALGAGLGANATPLGSTPNLITIKLSQRTRHPITTRIWLRTGLPVMLAVCLVASILYALTFRFM